MCVGSDSLVTGLLCSIVFSEGKIENKMILVIFHTYIYEEIKITRLIVKIF